MLVLLVRVHELTSASTAYGRLNNISCLPLYVVVSFPILLSRFFLEYGIVQLVVVLFAMANFVLQGLLQNGKTYAAIVSSISFLMFPFGLFVNLF